jgi:[ribosomal protein S18]-alanine N-acetyltransferase
MIDFRTYEAKDQDACLRAFRSNIPSYFAEKEVPVFLESLNDPDDWFEVLLLCGVVIGIGGIWVSEERKEARLCYGIVHKAYQKRGYGRILLERRLARISDFRFVEKVTHETGAGTYRFFEKFGFRTHRIDRDPLGIGIDFYQMEKKIQQIGAINSEGLCASP